MHSGQECVHAHIGEQDADKAYDCEDGRALSLVAPADPEVQVEAEPETAGADEADEAAEAEHEVEEPAEKTAAPEPEHVQAHIIEDEEPKAEAPAEEPAPSRSAPQPTETPKPIAKRKPGRFAVGFKLIAMGFKAIFTGRVTDRKDQ